MEKISFHIQTSKDGTVKVRFRLRDGRDVQLLHKSGIRCKIPDLAKLNPDGSTKDKVHVYNADLSALLKEEHRLMTTAYGLMKDKGMDMTSEVFEQEIESLRNPVVAVRKENLQRVSINRDTSDE